MFRFSILICILSLLACNSDQTTIGTDDKGREDFNDFHTAFYADSVFQIQRIEFPMMGYETDGSNASKLWDFDNWKFLQEVDDSVEGIEYLPFFDMGDLVRTRLMIQKKFMIECYFSLKENKWYMTGYSGMHDLDFFRK